MRCACFVLLRVPSLVFGWLGEVVSRFLPSARRVFSEYSFGGHEFDYSGVFNCEPRKAEGAKFREAIVVGTTTWTSNEIASLVSSLSEEYVGSRYNLISRNCNHFAEDLAKRVTGNSIPGWVNRLAKIGYMFHCLVPPKLMGPGPVVQDAPKAVGPNKSNFTRTLKNSKK